MKFDIHLNLGVIPTTKKKTQTVVTPEELANYIKNENLTHAMVLYLDNNDILKLRELVPPEIELFSLLWVTDIDKFNTTDLLDFTNGICIHSHRGTLDGENFGIDYTSPKLLKFFRKLPDNSIVCVHTQGNASPKSPSRGLSVAKWAVKFPNLKFLIEHAGSYFRTEFYPTMNVYSDLFTDMGQAFFMQAITSEVAIKEAITVADRLSNVFLDSSIVSGNNYKARLLHTSSFWGFGSDYPFERGMCSVTKQENIFKKYFKYDEVFIQQIHQRALDFFKLPVDELFLRRKQLPITNSLLVNEIETLINEDNPCES